MMAKQTGRIDMTFGVSATNRRMASDIAYYNNSQVMTFTMLHHTIGYHKYVLVRKR